MKVKVQTLDAKAGGDLELNDEIFGVEPRADILHRVVTWQLVNRRAPARADLQCGYGGGEVVQNAVGGPPPPVPRRGVQRLQSRKLHQPEPESASSPDVRGIPRDLGAQVDAVRLEVRILGRECTQMNANFIRVYSRSFAA